MADRTLKNEQVEPHHGQDKLRGWLKTQGFRCYENRFRYRENECNWVAYRYSKLAARSCECNDNKSGVQIAITPYATTEYGIRYSSTEVELRGEANGIWWSLRAYSLKAEELMERLDEIEASLVAAWNSLNQVERK